MPMLEQSFQDLRNVQVSSVFILVKHPDFYFLSLQFMVNGQSTEHGYHVNRELKKDSDTVIIPNRSLMEMTVLEATLSL